MAAVLIWPLFQVQYPEKWGSIEGSFLSDTRYLRDHWPHPMWQPYWYCGTRFDALRYGTAALSRALGVSTARLYHLYTAALYCAGIAGVYFLIRVVFETPLENVVGRALSGVSWGVVIWLPGRATLARVRY